MENHADNKAETKHAFTATKIGALAHLDRGNVCRSKVRQTFSNCKTSRADVTFGNALLTARLVYLRNAETLNKLNYVHSVHLPKVLWV